MDSKSTPGLTPAGIPLDRDGLPDVTEMVEKGWPITEALSVWGLANRSRAMAVSSPSIQ